MHTYHVLVAEPAPGHSLRTKLVEDDCFVNDGDNNPDNFFPAGSVLSVRDTGTFDVESSVARVMGDVYTETDD